MVNHCGIMWHDERYNFDRQHRFSMEWFDAVISLRVDPANTGASPRPINVSEGWLGKYDVVHQDTDGIGAPFFESARFDNAQIKPYLEVPAGGAANGFGFPMRRLLYDGRLF